MLSRPASALTPPAVCTSDGRLTTSLISSTLRKRAWFAFSVASIDLEL
jgi:hypothetical protein